MASRSSSPVGLTDLPTEILLDIWQNLDVESVFHLAATNKTFQAMLTAKKSSILIPVLQREFSPFEEFLQVFTASEEDLRTPGATLQPRRVIFKHVLTNARGIVLAPGGFIHAAPPPPVETFTEVRRFGRQKLLPIARGAEPPRTVVLGERDLESLLRYCLVVRKWEQLFPQLHWTKSPADCRWLTPEEKLRLRRALYRWWLYAFYFHGDMPRPRRGPPEAYVEDVRVSHMRMICTSELLELIELSEAVKCLVAQYICPCLENVTDSDLNDMSEEYLIFSSHESDYFRRRRVVSTYAKLDPQEMMHYFEKLYSYSRKRLIQDVRRCHPTFRHDLETLQLAIEAVAEERNWFDKLPQRSSSLAGGIVDMGDGVDAQDLERGSFGADASSDGELPRPGTYRPPHSDYSPPGDDGSIMPDSGYSGPGGRRLSVVASRYMF